MGITEPNNQILSIPTVNFSQATYKVNESSTGVVQTKITLTRTGDLSNISRVYLEPHTGSATRGTDWNFPPMFSGELTFNPNENSKPFTIDILPDDQVEGTQEIEFRITDRGNANIGSQSSATLQIFDPDSQLFDPDSLFTDTNVPISGVGSAIWGDYNNDGKLDILGSSRIYDNTRIFNKTDGSSTEYGFNESKRKDLPGSNSAWGDYNNDGLLDVTLSRYEFNSTSRRNAESTQIYRNIDNDFNIGNDFAFERQLPDVYPYDSQVTWGDSNNDGRLDILRTGVNNWGGFSTNLYRNEGAVNDQYSFNNWALPLSLPRSGGAAWADYDNDGKLDILLTVPNSNNYPTAKLYRNLGDGTFSDIGLKLPGLGYFDFVSSVAWGDSNNDGKLDILLTGLDGEGKPIVKVYRNQTSINDPKGFYDSGVQIPGLEYAQATWGDYDNDGRLDILLRGRDRPYYEAGQYITKIYRNTSSGSSDSFDDGVQVYSDLEPFGGYDQVPSTTWGDYDSDNKLDILVVHGSTTKVFHNNTSNTNTPPSPPTGLMVEPDGRNVTFKWNRAIDAQTPSLGLSYNLRVGTTSEGKDIISPMSLDDGTRQLVGLGNVNQNTQWQLKDLPLGTYHWSVQAIDTAWAGSPFAEEGSFTLANSSTGLNLSVPETLIGTLSSTDPDNPARTGRYRDDYSLVGVTPGQKVKINLDAPFDTYLQLVNADTNEVIKFNDDFGGSANSQLSFKVQPNINYLVRTTSYSSGTEGGYNLSATKITENSPPEQQMRLGGSYTEFNQAIKDVYTDLDGGPINYQLTLPDGSPLENGGSNTNWLRLQSNSSENTITFTGTPPTGSQPFEVKLIATDSYGASSEQTFTVTTKDGRWVIDGYIDGATVFLDANKNAVLDTNEPSTTTDTGGKFNLNIPFETFDTNKNGEIDPSEGNLVAIGGTDTATGLPLETPVTAPPDASVVTLLTTLIADLIDKGIEPESAQSLVKAALSLPGDVDLTSFDPIEATNNNVPGGVQVLAAMVKVQNFITQTSGLIDGASSAVNTDIVKAVVSSITNQIQSGTVLNLSNAAALEPIIQQAAAKIQQIDPSFNSQQVTQITSQSATVMATANQRIDAAVSNPTGTSIPESLARLQQVALGPTTQDFKEVGAGNKPISQLVADNTGTALDSRIEAVVLPVGIATPVVSGDADLGSNSPDAILGTNGDDILTGDSANNVLMGMRGNDSLDGVLGNDTIFGGKGSDTILGSSGDDVLFGNRGADILNGDDGNDILYGGKGDDLLNGGLGSDTLVGGMGVDKFLLSTNSGTDTITDFEVGQDLLVLGNGLSFSQLAIAQDSGATLIRLAQTGEILASLSGVSASSISAVNFGLI
ncbi:FG-GAP-like repeat-containing protein [Microcoleus sp. AT8-B1]|uniref:FG-GAP-like repeat-containing protein n=1 Tax=unclassified Microcoleus TaxID=2642155 RepID=UPI002FD59C7F